MRIANKLNVIAIAASLAVLHLVSEHLRGGVVTHYPLADASNPGISNWWGLLTIPALTWAVLAAIEWKDSRLKDPTQAAAGIILQKNYLIAGFAFGLTMGLLWEFGQEEILQYIIFFPWIAALLVRLYLPETTLGFVLGMMYTFGGVLPIAFALVIQTIGFIIYRVLNRGGKWLLTQAS